MRHQSSSPNRRPPRRPRQSRGSRPSGHDARGYGERRVPPDDKGVLTSLRYVKPCRRYVTAAAADHENVQNQRFHTFSTASISPMGDAARLSSDTSGETSEGTADVLGAPSGELPEETSAESWKINSPESTS